MRVLAIQNCSIEGFGIYEQVLRGRGIDYKLVHAYRDEPLPPLEGFDAILIGGTPISAYEAHSHPFLLAEREYLEKAVQEGKACFGICCGAQILAQILGATVHRCGQMEVGVYKAQLTEAGRSDVLLKGFPAHFPVFHWHGDTFELPTGAELLVEGEICRNQMFRWGNTVGVQFHLEVTGTEAGTWVDEYRDELAEFGRGKAEVIAECQEQEPEMEVLCTAVGKLP
jgi:GMP synthase-like glutamine amidotransferase